MGLFKVVGFQTTKSEKEQGKGDKEGEHFPILIDGRADPRDFLELSNPGALRCGMNL